MPIPQNTIEHILSKNKTDFGNHLEKYRNHVYRVFSLCKALDPAEENMEKYAIASVFHDIGIWTDNTFDYLEPSIDKAKQYLIKIGKNEWIEEISLMIDMHHKISRYTGPYQNTVETFRRADWIDVSMGIISFKVGKDQIKKTTQQYPVLGFHAFLVSQTFKNLLRSPLNPLPMFKK